MDDVEILDPTQAEETVETSGASPDATGLEAPPTPVDEETPEGLSEPQVSNWKALRMARDEANTKAESLESELNQFKSKIEPIESAFDDLVELGNLMRPLNPDPAAIQNTIRRAFPVADRYLAGHYLREWGDWYVEQLTGGAVKSAADLQTFVSSGRPATGAAPQPTTPGPGVADAQLREQLSYLDPEIRAAIEERLGRVDQLAEQVKTFNEQQQRAQQQQMEQQRFQLENRYVQERGQKVDELLKIAKVQPTTPDGKPNQMYGWVKGLVALEMAANDEANQYLETGKQAYALGQRVEAERCARELNRLLGEAFVRVTNGVLTPVQQAQIAAQAQREQRAHDAPKAPLTGGAVPPPAPTNGKREYSRDPEERRRQLMANVKGFFGQK